MAILRSLFRALRPPRRSTAERLAAFPTAGLAVERDVTIRWNDYQVPFIEAESDHDLFFALGMVHAHLRGPQIALFIHFFQGRLAEVFGPVAKRLDHALRILDYGAAVPEIERTLPDETRQCCEAFLDGINSYNERITELPPEFGVLGLKPERHTMATLLAGSRLASTDFTWITYMSLLPRRARPGFTRLWNRTIEAGESPTPGAHAEGTPGMLEDLLVGAGRAGSNSFAVAPQRSATGAALLANDPHLGLSLPSLWLLGGLRSPSFHVAGFMIPGLPAIMLGRNPDLAWGGTNMRASSSDLYDVGDLPAEQIVTSETTIKARCWRSSRHRIRHTPFGPIINDAKALNVQGRPLALRWVGHEPSDELTAFLNAARARTPDEFRAAFAPYAVSGQNMVFADRAGNIGKIMAVRAPLRAPFPKDDPVLNAADPATHWRGFQCATELPWVVNPPAGVLASANDRPLGTDVPIGFTFGADDRIRRLYELLRAHDKISIDNLRTIQTDTNAPDAAKMAGELAQQIEALNLPVRPDKFLRRLSRWNGDYAADAFGAAAFEALLFHLVPPLYGGKRQADLPDLLGQWSYLTMFLLRDLMAIKPAKRNKILRRAVAKAERDAARYRQWGDMHRLRIGHTLARLPLIGRAFMVEDMPVGGSRQTPMKMAHGLVNRRHAATFGQMARHISDLGDPDANWFVILGGQDAWLGSANYADQIGLWLRRQYIHMPLRRETVAAEFPHVMTLKASA